MGQKENVLSVGKKIRANGWTKEEEELFTEKYQANMSFKELNKLFPNRSYSALVQRVHTLGLFKGNKSCLWTKAEEKLLKQKYKTDICFEELSELFPNRSYSALLHKAHQLGVLKGKYIPIANSDKARKWTKDEIHTLKTFYHSKTPAEMKILLPGRTLSAMKGFLIDKGIPTTKLKKRNLREQTSWSDLEIEILVENYNKLTYEELVEILPNRTHGAIRSRIAILGLRRGRQVWSNYKAKGVFKIWRDEELQILNDYRGKPADEIHKLLPHRSVYGIKLKMKQLNLGATKGIQVSNPLIPELN